MIDTRLRARLRAAVRAHPQAEGWLPRARAGARRVLFGTVGSWLFRCVATMFALGAAWHAPEHPALVGVIALVGIVLSCHRANAAHGVFNDGAAWLPFRLLPIADGVVVRSLERRFLGPAVLGWSFVESAAFLVLAWRLDLAEPLSWAMAVGFGVGHVCVQCAVALLLLRFVPHGVILILLAVAAICAVFALHPGLRAASAGFTMPMLAGVASWSPQGLLLPEADTQGSRLTGWAIAIVVAAMAAIGWHHLRSDFIERFRLVPAGEDPDEGDSPAPPAGAGAGGVVVAGTASEPQPEPCDPAGQAALAQRWASRRGQAPLAELSAQGFAGRWLVRLLPPRLRLAVAALRPTGLDLERRWRWTLLQLALAALCAGFGLAALGIWIAVFACAMRTPLLGGTWLGVGERVRVAGFAPGDLMPIPQHQAIQAIQAVNAWRVLWAAPVFALAVPVLALHPDLAWTAAAAIAAKVWWCALALVPVSALIAWSLNRSGRPTALTLRLLVLAVPYIAIAVVLLAAVVLLFTTPGWWACVPGAALPVAAWAIVAVARWSYRRGWSDPVGA